MKNGLWSAGLDLCYWAQTEGSELFYNYPFIFEFEKIKYHTCLYPVHFIG